MKRLWIYFLLMGPKEEGRRERMNSHTIWLLTHAPAYNTTGVGTEYITLQVCRPDGWNISSGGGGSATLLCISCTAAPVSFHCTLDTLVSDRVCRGPPILLLVSVCKHVCNSVCWCLYYGAFTSIEFRWDVMTYKCIKIVQFSFIIALWSSPNPQKYSVYIDAKRDKLQNLAFEKLKVVHVFTSIFEKKIWMGWCFDISLIVCLSCCQPVCLPASVVHPSVYLYPDDLHSCLPMPSVSLCPAVYSLMCLYICLPSQYVHLYFKGLFLCLCSHTSAWRHQGWAGTLGSMARGQLDLLPAWVDNVFPQSGHRGTVGPEKSMGGLRRDGCT